MSEFRISKYEGDWRILLYKGNKQKPVFDPKNNDWLGLSLPIKDNLPGELRAGQGRAFDTEQEARNYFKNNRATLMAHAEKVGVVNPADP
jgi:hypothetical protein